jgi:hypothetical protein
MTQAQDELTISNAGDKIAEPRLDAVALPPPNPPNTFSRRDETIGLLIFTGIAFFIADIVVRQILRGRVGEAGVLLILAVVGSQWMLLSIWLGLGNWPLPFRMLSSMLLVAAGMLLVIEDSGPPDFWPAVWGGSLLLAATSLPFGLLKLIGFRLVHGEVRADHPANSGRNANRGLHAIQFSVRNLLSWTASAAIVAALARGLQPFDLMAVVPISIHAAITAAIGGTSLWAALSRYPVWPRALAPLAVSLFIGLLFTLSDAPSRIKAGILISMMLLSVAVMVILRLFRRLGWRIAFRPAVVNAAAADRVE